MIRDLFAAMSGNGWYFAAAVLLAGLAGVFIGCAFPGRRT